MKKIFFLWTLIFFVSCSFDNKTGIWNSGVESEIKDRQFKDFETLNSSIDIFNEEINPQKGLNIKPSPLINNLQWNDQYYQTSNNLDNFSFTNLNKLVFKSKRLSKSNISSNLFFDGKNILIVDEKGTIVVYSLESQQIVLKYNFYKKRFKKLRKKIS